MLAMSSLVAKGNLRSFFFFWLGSTTTSTILYFIVLTGLSAIPENYGVIFIFFKAMAAVAFIMMGLFTIQENQEFSEQEIEERAKKISIRDTYSNIMAGFTLSLSNPYDIIFIFTVIPSLVGLTVFSLQDIMLIRGTVIVTDILVLCSYCIPIYLVRKKLSQEKLKKIRFFCGIAMIGIGIFLMTNILLQFDLIKSDLINVF